MRTAEDIGDRKLGALKQRDGLCVFCDRIHYRPEEHVPLNAGRPLAVRPYKHIMICEYHYHELYDWTIRAGQLAKRREMRRLLQEYLKGIDRTDRL